MGLTKQRILTLATDSDGEIIELFSLKWPDLSEEIPSVKSFLNDIIKDSLEFREELMDSLRVDDLYAEDSPMFTISYDSYDRPTLMINFDMEYEIQPLFTWIYDFNFPAQAPPDGPGNRD